jgi:hypothetical protein
LSSSESKFNFELRIDESGISKDFYVTLVNFSEEVRLMNVRIRGDEIVEYYPEASMKDISVIKNNLDLCDVENYSPYVSKTPGSDDPTHLYSVSKKDVWFKFPIMNSDYRIIRWGVNDETRIYTYISSLRKQTLPDCKYKKKMSGWNSDYAIFYHDTENDEITYKSFLIGFKPSNPSYDEAVRLVQV